MAASPNQIDQQRRIITGAQQDVSHLLDAIARIEQRLSTHGRLKLSNANALDDKAFEGTGTDAASYRDAIGALKAIQGLDASAWAALEAFAR